MNRTKASKSHKIILFISLFLLIGAVSLLLSQINSRQISKSKATGDCSITNTQIQQKQQEQLLFNQINSYRVEQNVPALQWSSTLKRPAAWMSSDMLKSKSVSYIDSLGRNTAIRFPDCDVSIDIPYGENIAAGPANAKDILDAWKASDTHNQLLLNPVYTQAAIAMEVNTSDGLAYWTLDLSGASLTSPSPSSEPTPSLPDISTSPPVSTNPTITEVITPTVIENPTIPTPTTGPLTVDMQIGVKVKIAGIGTGGNIYPRHLTRRVVAIVYGPENVPVVSGTGFLAYDKIDYFTGTIHLGKMNQGIYFIKIVSDTTLLKLVKPEFQLLKANQVNMLPAVTLYQGDITQDNTLSIDDYNIALTCFQDKHCQSQNIIDFNDDGITDVTDYNYLLRSFAEFRGN